MSSRTSDGVGVLGVIKAKVGSGGFDRRLLTQALGGSSGGGSERGSTRNGTGCRKALHFASSALMTMPPAISGAPCIEYYPMTLAKAN